MHPRLHILASKAIHLSWQLLAASFDTFSLHLCKHCWCCSSTRCDCYTWHALAVKALFIPGTAVQDYFEDPVTAADDYTYERYAITDWLSKHNTSPMTNLPLPHQGLVLNGSIKVQMQALLQQLTPAKQVEVANYLS